jgi:hypothetical protein
MTGKEKCALLKKLRADIAKNNGIDGFEYEECHHQGPCKGTCPACDSEGVALAKALQKIGKQIPTGNSTADEFDDQDVLAGMVEMVGEIEAQQDWAAKRVIDESESIPKDILSGKILPAKKTGKISKNFTTKERIKDDTCLIDPRGLHKTDDEKD